VTMSGLTGREWPRVQVSPGSGVVDRHSDILLVVPALPRTGLEPVRELLRLCRRPDPTGRDRAASLRALLDRPPPAQPPAFALLIRGDRALRVFAHGPMAVRIDGEATGTAGGAPLDERVVEDGWRELTVAADGPTGAPEAADALGLDLEAGRVPGSAVTLHPAPASPEPAAARSETALQPVVRFRSVLLGESAARARGGKPARVRRPPLPVVGAAPGDDAPSTGPEVLVEGVHCARGHLTDPGRPTCLTCGTPLAPGGQRIAGPRPPLGVLVTDGGTIYPVTGDVVIGRDPDRAPEVLTGRARPLRLSDAERSTSRVHAHLTVDGWRVLLTDDGSANGTFMSGSGAAGPWLPVPPGAPVPLAHGDRVRLGRRQLLFDTWREGVVPSAFR